MIAGCTEGREVGEDREIADLAGPWPVSVPDTARADTAHADTARADV